MTKKNIVILVCSIVAIVIIIAIILLSLNTKIDSNKIYKIVFDNGNGEIIEQGSHKELMMYSDGLYKDMFEKQSSYYKEG